MIVLTIVIKEVQIMAVPKRRLSQCRRDRRKALEIEALLCSTPHNATNPRCLIVFALHVVTIWKVGS